MHERKGGNSNSEVQLELVLVMSQFFSFKDFVPNNMSHRGELTRRSDPDICNDAGCGFSTVPLGI